jgi:hypothetical protein
MRPIAFDDHEDYEPLDSFLPPRRFAMPQSAPELVEEPAPALETAEQAAADPVETQDDGYASLLEIKSPAKSFVRIDEPAEESPAIEPVVIFPGQEVRPTFAQPASSPLASASVRPFDGPASPIAPTRIPTPAAHAIDPQETERQLKAALATLQRMSGAA